MLNVPPPHRQLPYQDFEKGLKAQLLAIKDRGSQLYYMALYKNTATDLICYYRILEDTKNRLKTSNNYNKPKELTFLRKLKICTCYATPSISISADARQCFQSIL